MEIFIGISIENGKVEVRQLSWDEIVELVIENGDAIAKKW